MVYELQIDHGTFLARYGEIAANLAPGIGPNTEVKEGQLIAYVGKQSVANMLHFEMFANPSDKTDLLAMGNMRYPHLPKPTKTYNRRPDLLNPTAYLDRCAVIGYVPPKHHLTEKR